MRINLINTLKSIFSLAKSKKQNEDFFHLQETNEDLFNLQIQTWKNAVEKFKDKNNPNSRELMDMYEGLQWDGVLSNLTETCVESIALCEYNIVNEDGTPDEYSTQLLRRKWFRDFLEIAVMTEFYGHSLVVLKDYYDGEIHSVELVPRRHVVPQEGIVSAYAGQNTGVSYKEPPVSDWVVEMGGCNDIGLFCKIAPYNIWKKWAMVAWNEYIEMFGQPFRVAYTNNQTETHKQSLYYQLSNMGRKAFGIFTEGEDKVDFVTDTRQSASDIYKTLVDYLDEKITITVLGQTMTTIDGSSRSQAEVHFAVQKEKMRAWKIYVEDDVTLKLFPVLEKHGYPLQGKRLQFVEPHENTLEVDKWLAETFVVDPGYFANKYRVPIEGYKNETTPTVTAKKKALK